MPGPFSSCGHINVSAGCKAALQNATHPRPPARALEFPGSGRARRVAPEHRVPLCIQDHASRRQPLGAQRLEKKLLASVLQAASSHALVSQSVNAR